MSLNNSSNFVHFCTHNCQNTSFDEASETPERRWNPPELVPSCLSSSLNTVSVKGFKGRQHEMEVAKYLLNYGEVLNTMIISTKDWLDMQEGRPHKTEEELCKEFRVFQKGSKICQVKIIYDAGLDFFWKVQFSVLERLELFSCLFWILFKFLINHGELLVFIFLIIWKFWSCIGNSRTLSTFA